MTEASGTTMSMANRLNTPLPCGQRGVGPAAFWCVGNEVAGRTIELEDDMTWHQINAIRRDGIRPYRHPTKWTVENGAGDGEFSTLARFDTEEEAKSYAGRTGGLVIRPFRKATED